MPEPTTTAPPPLAPSARTRQPHHRRRVVMRWVKRGLFVALAAGLVAGLVYAWMPKPTIVEAASVRRATLDVEVSEDGQTRVRDRFVVAAPITGELARIELEPGTAVTTGTPLATLHPPTSQLLDARSREEASARLAGANAHRQTAGASIERARVARDAAIKEADRARKLAERQAIAIADLDRAELAEQLARRDLTAAEAEQSAANAEVAAARAVLEADRGGRPTAAKIVVTAPTDGAILRVLRDSAGPVIAGTPLLELGDLHAIEVVVDVLSSDAAQIAPGMTVRIERWGGDRPLVARVRRVEPSAFTRISALGVEEQRVRVIAALEAPPPSLGDGFRVSARIVTWHGDAVLTIPASAVFRDHGQFAVYVIASERAALRPIELGHRGRIEVEVLRGLAEGERVIIHPGDRVHPDARVEPAFSTESL